MTWGGVNTTNSTYVVPTSGIYLFNAAIYASGQTADSFFLYINVNGATSATGITRNGTAEVFLNIAIKLTAGDVVKIYGSWNSGVASATIPIGNCNVVGTFLRPT